MASKPDGSSPTTSHASLGLGLSAAVLAFLTFFKGEDAWLSAGLLLFAAVFGVATCTSIWFHVIQTRRPLAALGASFVLASSMAGAALAGHWMRKADLMPTRERVESLAAAVADHHRAHGVLPLSLAEIDASLPKPGRDLYKISYKPGVNGEFSLFFQPSWYRHEYSSFTRSWVMSD